MNQYEIREAFNAIFSADVAFKWWAGRTREEKVRWLKCGAAPEQIDAELWSRDMKVRAAAGDSLLDACNAFTNAFNAQQEKRSGPAGE